ncbi:OB-fold nucleic acid binding domain-containing protein [Candidatus Woesearchaeota archaeon]|nr:OB-fold nucleic acid binding domain-containing protein [Candidatus Woesearchaeota archaeon]
MKEKTLIKISIIITILGLGILFLIADNIEVTEDSITPNNIDRDIKVSGVVNKVTDLGKVMFIDITEAKPCTILIFKKEYQAYQIKKGDSIIATGELEEYNGTLELIANDIVKR